jgi:hypothetical protein
MMQDVKCIAWILASFCTKYETISVILMCLTC